MGNTYMKQQEFKEGIRDGIPICLGYLSVSMAFGLTAVKAGIPVWAAIVISMTNLTSAGQFAGTTLLVAQGTYMELLVTTFIINIRYFLMSLSVSQKVDKGFQTKERLITSFGVTDEVFAVSMQRRQELTLSYMLGLIIPPIIGWSLGTVIGAVATSLLPEILTDAMGIMLYGMFIAIIVPPAREHRSVLTVIILAVVASYAFAYLPGLNQISGGWAIIIITLVVSGIGAFLFPVEDENEKHEAVAVDKEGA